ncbi:DNA internalization-related competence protein ComEC/Rec2 [Metabacillus malikii]|uniref:Competence protein ComEC n=1 Tax=Metabacillus malikii TaxID=1504265 RepID=A0ABT9ZH24_9BACI|nr:DNA internalization-related competence protein ComEC/Rec2 [Metabacillus malikii]MDQ0231572.1 competence protein ComEC [Metabacillus malikii]
MNGKLIFLVIAACFGILTCKYQFHPLLVMTTLSFLLLLFIKKFYNLCLFCFITTVLFGIIYLFIDDNNRTLLQQGDYSDVGVVASIPKVDGDLLRAEIVISSKEKVTITYIIQSYEEKVKLKKLMVGMTCQFEGELVKPKSRTMPNAFDYRQYLYEHHIHWQYIVDKLVACKSSSNNINILLKNWRKAGLDFIEKHFPSDSIGVVQALLFGERSLLEEDVETAYQELGIVHLLAISGLHVGILTSGVYFIFIYSGLTHENARRLLLVILPIYVIVTGVSPSVTRASFMAILYIVFKLLKKNVSSLDVISITCLALLIINPYYLFHIGFQLSYIVTYSLLLSFRILSKLSNFISKLIVISLIAQLGAMPILLFHFYEVSLISIPMNMLFVPLYSYIILPIAIFSTVCTLLSQDFGNYIIYVFDEILQFSHHLALFASSLPYTTLTTGRPHIIILLLLCFTTLTFLLIFEGNKDKVKAIFSFNLIIIVLIVQLVLPYLNPSGKVLFMDVGQGDAIFIQLPHNKGNYLIDTGGKLSFPKEEWQLRKSSFSIAKNVVVPYLKSQGITKLNGLFLTHGDFDHVGETLELMEGVEIEKLFVPKGFIRGDLEGEIINKAMDKNIKIRVLSRGDILSLHHITFYILSPNQLTNNKNEDSLVLYCVIGGVKWLFTGDAEEEAEKSIISHYPRLDVDVLKLGHHGSKGSTIPELLDHIKPKIAVVSAGFNNRYQHPHKEVLERLKERNIKLFRTDLQGGILFEYTGLNGTFYTHPPYK